MRIPSLSKREHIRLKIPSTDVVEVDINGENFIDRLGVTDISENGLGVSVDHDFEGCMINQQVDFIVRLPREKGYSLIKTKGRIRHVANHYFGISFDTISDESRSLIRQYIAQELTHEQEGLYRQHHNLKRTSQSLA